MSGLAAVAAAHSDRAGVAVRVRAYRHTVLVDQPIAVALLAPGGEPFTVAAVAYGRQRSRHRLAVVGQPLNRDELFEELTDVAEWFCAAFEEPWGRRATVPRSARSRERVERAPMAPQVLVPNAGTVTAFRNLGRRLAYLPTVSTPDGPQPAPEILVRFGRHLQFLAEAHRRPGSALCVDTVTMAAQGWSTPQTDEARAHLAALDAWIDPPDAVHAYRAARDAARQDVGPLTMPETERELEPLVTAYDEARKAGRSGAATAVKQRLQREYRRLLDRAWELMWRVRDREETHPLEARFAQARWAQDADIYSNHMAWMDGPAQGRRRTRMTPRQAIRTRYELEERTTRVTAEMIVADPLLQIDELLDGRGIEATVVAADHNRRVVKPGNTRRSLEPELTLRTDVPSLVPAGETLYWTEDPRVAVRLDTVAPNGDGSVITGRVSGGARFAQALRRGVTMTLTVHNLDSHGYRQLPRTDPFTHAVADITGPAHLEIVT